MTNLPKVKLSLIFLAGLLISLFLYKDSLDYYFFQDDFFEINISQATNLKEYLSFFKFRDDIIAYRPISLQNYFFISHSLFGLNPVGFRTITFLLFFLSGFLIYKVTTRIFKSSKTGLIASFLWQTSSIHFMAITWIAAAYNIIGTFFWLLTAFMFLKFIETQKLLFFVLTFLSFLITVGSYEFSVTWPAIWGFYYFFVAKNSLVKSLKLFSPFIIVSSIYILARFIFIKVPQITEYTTTFNLESVKALFWYILWTFNIPEEFKKQVINNLIVFNPKFFYEYWPLVLKSFLSALIILLVVTIPITAHIKQIKMKGKLIVFLLFWFIAGISPVLILPNHTFSMYLTLASIGLYGCIAYLLSKTASTLSLIVLSIWLLSSFTTLSFYKINSWIIETQKTAKKFSQEVKMQFPYLPPNAVILYPLNAKFEKQALLENHAIRTIYNDPTLTIYYNKEALIKDASSLRGKPVYIHIPE